MSLPVKKWARSWDAAPAAGAIEHEARLELVGSTIEALRELVGRHGGACRLGSTPSTFSCSATFSWRSYRRQEGKSIEARPRLCLEYGIRTEGQIVTSVSVAPTCFEPMK